jgi:hypothetical protein
MTLRERVTAVLEGRTPDAVPWFTDMTYWHHGQQVAGTLPAKYEGPDGLLELHRDLGVGVYLFTPPLVRVERDPDLFRRESRPLDEKRTQIVVSSPEGTLTGIAERCEQSASSAVLEWPVKTAGDLRVVRAWYESALYVPNYEAVHECDRAWGDAGFAVPLTPRTPLAALAAEWAGLMNLTYLMAEAPGEFERTLEGMRRCEDVLYRLLAAAPYPVIEIPDNLSSEAMCGLWRRHSRDYYRERIDLFHASGKKIGCHIDGTLGALLGELVDVGVDFPESVVPAPVGDLTPQEIRDAVKPETIIWGGVPAAMFAPPFAQEDVLDFVRDAVRVLGAGGKLVLAGADQVPPNGDIDTVRRIGDLLNELGPPSGDC